MSPNICMCVDVTSICSASDRKSKSPSPTQVSLATSSVPSASGAHARSAQHIVTPSHFLAHIEYSDGISMGTKAMSYSLQSRDLIADSVETAAGGHWLDGLVVIPGCDKNMPGVLMAREFSCIYTVFSA